MMMWWLLYDDPCRHWSGIRHHALRTWHVEILNNLSWMSNRHFVSITFSKQSNQITIRAVPIKDYISWYWHCAFRVRAREIKICNSIDMTVRISLFSVKMLSDSLSTPDMKYYIYVCIFPITTICTKLVFYAKCMHVLFLIL